LLIHRKTYIINEKNYNKVMTAIGSSPVSIDIWTIGQKDWDESSRSTSPIEEAVVSGSSDLQGSEKRSPNESDKVSPIPRTESLDSVDDLIMDDPFLAVDEEMIWYTERNRSLRLRTLRYFLEELKKGDAILEKIPTELFENEDFLRRAIAINSSTLLYISDVPDSLLDWLREHCLEQLEEGNLEVLQILPPKLQKDSEFFLSALSINVSFLDYVSDSLMRDRDFLYELSIQLSSEDLSLQDIKVVQKFWSRVQSLIIRTLPQYVRDDLSEYIHQVCRKYCLKELKKRNYDIVKRMSVRLRNDPMILNKIPQRFLQSCGRDF
jgi:hypothetical protein